MTMNIKETKLILTMILFVTCLLTGAYAVGQTNKREKASGFICMFICILIEIGLYFNV